MKKIRKYVSLAAMLVMVFTMTAGVSENIYADDDTEKTESGRNSDGKDGREAYTEKELPVFKGELTDETITVRYYDKSPNVPYIGIKEYYDCIMEDSFDDEDKTLSVKKDGENRYILKSAHGEAVVDTDKDVMTSENMSDFTNIMCLIQEGMSNCYVDGLPYVRVEDTQESGSGRAEFDFSKYNIEIYGDKTDVYFPESTLSDIFTDLVYHYSVCNGETFYFNCINPCEQDNIADIDPDYAIPIVEGLENGIDRPEDMTEFAYNELCFSFDNFYGLPGKAALNDELEEKGLEQALIDYGEEGKKTIELLKSSNFAEYLCGLRKLQLFVNDAGHTGVNYFRLENARTDKISDEVKKIEEELEPMFKNIKGESDEISHPWDYHRARIKLRDDVYKGEKYIKEGDTAVYILDGFMGFDMDKWNKYYKEGGAKPTILTMRDDDMLLIDECMKDADKDPEIRNFVIDCSNNTGGSLDEVAMLFCMVTGKREAVFHMENALTGQKITETYEADLNLDKIFDENDEREPYDLNFAVLTSPSSFSCGNVFPAVMKDAGYMILGEQSGGGGCAVMVQTTGEGLTYRISAYKGRLVNKEGEGIDNGVEVDVDLVPRRSNGKLKFITVNDVESSSGEKGDVRIPDYSEFYNIERLSEEINKFYSEK